MKRYLIELVIFIFLSFITNAQIAQWTFEGVTLSGASSNSPLITAGSSQADFGTQTAGSTFTGFHSSSSSTWSTPTGNGSSKCILSSNWAINDYYQFLFSTMGYNSITITWDIRGSDTGPRDYKVQYSIDGTSFTDATGTNSIYTVANNTWNSSTPVGASRLTLDLSGVAVINNNPSVYIRLINTSNVSVVGGIVGNSGTNAVDNFTVNGTLISSSTDYFRSIISGNWNNPSTWEQSSDNVTWSPAITVPNRVANTIRIRNTHNVTISVSTSADQVVIENGGNLLHTGGTITLFDGTGNDLDIQTGGIFTLSSPANPPQFSGLSPTINVNTGAILRVSATGLTEPAPTNGVNISNYIYQDQSILEYTPSLPFSTSSNTFFPNVNATTIPIFRALNTGPITVGGVTFTTFNGVFESAGAGVNWQFGGTKTFRNGIIGSGDVTAIASSGPFLINGSSAILGGTGVIFSPFAGLQIGINSTVTMISNKSITNNISLLANSYVDLGIYNLSINGNILGGGTNSYIRTNGTGTLILKTIIPGTSKLFPVGKTSYNPVTITNNGVSIIDYNVKVETGIIPLPSLPTYGINRTWSIGASTVAPNTIVSFQYGAADAGVNVSPSENMEVLRNDGISWSILPGNNNILPAGTNPYVVTMLVPITVNNISEPYAVGKSGGYILPIDFFISANSQKRNNTGIINWKVFETSNVKSFEIQRSVNNEAFVTIATINPVSGQLDYTFSDNELQKGTSLYRIKVNRLSGTTRYSNTVAIINDTKGLLITALTPNPVVGSAMLTVSAARSSVVHMQLVNISGVVVRQWRSAVVEGTNQLSLDLSTLPAGVYHLVLQTADSKAVYRLVKQ